jgi:hypothetical protein
MRERSVLYIMSKYKAEFGSRPGRNDWDDQAQKNLIELK